MNKYQCKVCHNIREHPTDFGEYEISITCEGNCKEENGNRTVTMHKKVK